MTTVIAKIRRLKMIMTTRKSSYIFGAIDLTKRRTSVVTERIARLFPMKY